jgi:hypothetical protein
MYKYSKVIMVTASGSMVEELEVRQVVGTGRSRYEVLTAVVGIARSVSRLDLSAKPVLKVSRDSNIKI